MLKIQTFHRDASMIEVHGTIGEGDAAKKYDHIGEPRAVARALAETCGKHDPSDEFLDVMVRRLGKLRTGRMVNLDVSEQSLVADPTPTELEAVRPAEDEPAPIEDEVDARAEIERAETADDEDEGESEEDQ